MMALTALLSLSLAGRPARPVAQIRAVYVTDSHCGVDGLEKKRPHVETLACVAKGAHLQLYDRRRDILYKIQYASEEMRIELQNDYAGLQVAAQGLWDDSERRVKLQTIWPARDPDSPRMPSPEDE
jgi:hypothetical protein